MVTRTGSGLIYTYFPYLFINQNINRNARRHVAVYVNCIPCIAAKENKITNNKEETNRNKYCTSTHCSWLNIWQSIHFMKFLARSTVRTLVMGPNVPRPTSVIWLSLKYNRRIKRIPRNELESSLRSWLWFMCSTRSTVFRANVPL
jgi:hypothetical protein